MKNLKFFLLTIVMMVIGYNTWAQCPTIAAGNISRGTDGGVCTAVTSYSPTISPTTATVTYLFTGATAGSGSGTGSGSTFNKGITTVRLTATDNGCTTTRTFRVTVNDNQAPTISCPASNAFYADPGQCSAVLEYVAPTVANGKITDNCGIGSVTRTAGLPSGSTFPVGTTTVGFRVYDTSGNQKTCSFTVTVIDDQAPTITCPPNLIVPQGTGGCAGGVASFPKPTASDECGIEFTWLISGLASGSCFPIGETENTWVSIDNNGNIATCTHTISVSPPPPTQMGMEMGADRGMDLKNFSIYPNPSTGNTTVLSQNGGSLFSATGILISSWSQDEMKINGLAPGVYYVKADGVTKRLVVTQ